jgi:hypothetical protein
VTFYGTGVLHWKVRANFPSNGVGEVHGPYAPAQSFTRRIDAPPGAHHVNDPRHMLLSWDPGPEVKEYKIQVSSTDSFSSNIVNETTQNTNLAPKLTERGFQEGGRLWWRVASVDEGRNVGAWSTRELSLLKLMQIRARGLKGKGKRAVVTVTVTDSKRRPVRRAKVRVTGAGVKAASKRSNKKGVVRFKLRPRKKGRVIFRAKKGGYQPARATSQVR